MIESVDAIFVGIFRGDAVLPGGKQRQQLRHLLFLFRICSAKPCLTEVDDRFTPVAELVVTKCEIVGDLRKKRLEFQALFEDSGGFLKFACFVEPFRIAEVVLDALVNLFIEVLERLGDVFRLDECLRFGVPGPSLSEMPGFFERFASAVMALTCDSSSFFWVFSKLSAFRLEQNRRKETREVA